LILNPAIFFDLFLVTFFPTPFSARGKGLAAPFFLLFSAELSVAR